MKDYNSALLAHKIEEYPDDAHVADHDETVWHGIELAADRVEKKYQCALCAYKDGCQEGLWCYKDYLERRAYNIRSQESAEMKPPKQYDYYFRRK